jgi:hypothetical protein
VQKKVWRAVPAHAQPDRAFTAIDLGQLETFEEHLASPASA